MPTTILEPEVATQYRCRIYRDEVDVLPGKDLFVGVWDTLEDPHPDNDLPDRELVADCRAESSIDLQRQVKDVLYRHGSPMMGSWRDRGSI